jgi:hypothetical protein
MFFFPWLDFGCFFNALQCSVKNGEIIRANPKGFIYLAVEPCRIFRLGDRTLAMMTGIITANSVRRAKSSRRTSPTLESGPHRFKPEKYDAKDGISSYDVVVVIFRGM